MSRRRLLLALLLALPLLLLPLLLPAFQRELTLWGTLRLQQPRYLALLGLLPLLPLVLPLSLTDFDGRQLALQAACRALLVAVLALALARPAQEAERQTVCLVVLVDASDSVSDAQLQASQRLVDELRGAAQARGDELHLVTFGARPRIVPLPPPGQPLPRLRLPGDLGSGSNLQAALQLAYGLYPDGVLRRALLLSDGNQTEGDVLAESQEARRRGVRLDHQVLSAEDSAEVLVRGLRMAGGDQAESEARVGAPFTLEAEVYASVPQRARVTLLQGAAENPGDGHQDVDLAPGRNLVRFRSEVRSAGYVLYKAQVGPASGQPLRDRFPDNNAALLSLSVKGRPRVLYIEGETRSRGYLTQALTREDIEVEARDAYGLPTSARELSRYDLVILSDVSSTLVSQAQMQAIDSYVRDLGGGFLMAGGENSFGSGGYQGTLIEKVLPVRFEQEKKRDQPTLGLVLAIDRSGSMNGPKLELAKEAARGTAEMLGADDLIGVVAFDSQATALVRLQRAANRVRISSDISRLQAGGGTNFLPALQESFQQLAVAPARIKHVILLTDGQAEYQGVLELVDQMVEQKITVSAVGVGAGADQTLLAAIAEHGGGRFYYTQDATNIPKIFTKETTQVARSALIEELVRAVVEKRAEVLDGTGIESAPPLRGYVATKPKALTETLLRVSSGDPLLVRWRYGLGQAVAFTSDVKNRWAVEWLRWPGYARFFAQLVRSAMRHDPRTRGHGYDLRAAVYPPQVQVTVDAVGSDDRFISGLATTLEVIAPDAALGPGQGRRVLAVPMAQVAPGRYAADFSLPLALRDQRGAFLLRALHRSQSPEGGLGPVVAESWGALSLSYPREYLALPPDAALLREASMAPPLRDVRQALDPGAERVRFLRSLWPLLAGAAAVLLLLDVALRRVRLFGYRALSL